jgi:hypothetical protein
MTIRRTLAAALAATAIAAPAATAQPADMHASTVPAAAQAQRGQDLRSPDAIDAAVHPRKPVNAPGATAADSQSTINPVAPGQPTWATSPKPIAPPAPAAVAHSDDGIDWTTIGIGIAGTLLALGGIVALTSRSRRLPRPRVSV